MLDREDELLALLSRAALDVAGRRLEGLDMDTRLAAFGIDSVGVLEMVTYIEDALGLRFPDDEIARLVTVRDVAMLIERTRRSAEAAG
jgi:acyl carrier protein